MRKSMLCLSLFLGVGLVSCNPEEPYFHEYDGLPVLEVKIAPPPPCSGDNYFECYSEEPGIVVNVGYVKYILDVDGKATSIKNSNQLKINTLYGSYNPDNCEQTTEFTTLYYLTALYTYDPSL